MSIPTTITHGAMVIDMDAEDNITISRTDVAQTVRISLTEWRYLLLVALLHGWPMVSPGQVEAAILAALDTQTQCK